jgi:2,3-bisphosphoglycerate-dependent phosphoglycerate mutase
MTARLLIARHGNTFGPGDVVTRVGGRTDLPLVASGIEQGRMLGRYLKAANLIPSAVYTSNLKRTRQTAEAAFGEMGLPPVLKPLDIFDEIDYGPDENKPETEVVERLGTAALEAWDAEGVVPPGWNVDPAAITANWVDFANGLSSGTTTLVVTSNGIARFVPHITGDFASFRAAHNIKISTGALCVFENSGSGWTCTGWNVKPKELLAA